jgi:tripartite-type tricarboxylate transporter receptor subunit TctC
MLVVNPALPATDIKTFIALAKSRKEPLRFASSGNGSSQHLAAELFMQMTGVKMMHVPYKGSMQAAVDLISGQVDLNFDGVGSALQFVRGGKLKVLGVATAKRVSLIPEVPTIIESGLPGFTAQSWFGVFAPAGAAAEIVTRLADDINGFLKSPEVIRKVTDIGGELAPPNTPAEYTRFVQNETARWSKVIREANIKAE